MIVFRADGNSKIGSGHIMRCLSIADAALSKGEDCCFIMASDDFSEMIDSRGYKHYELGTDYSNLESEDCISLLKELRPDSMVVDSFSVTYQYLNNLHNYCKKSGIALIYCDDTLVFPYPCDILINYHIFASDEEYSLLYNEKQKPRLLLNTMYVPLRREFQALGDCSKNSFEGNILVSTGGADPEHITIEIIKRAREISNLSFHIVVGALNKDKEQIYEVATGYENIVIHENAVMSKLMMKCDMAISAAGATLYELCLTQTPTITFVSSDNQIPIAEGFSSKGLMKNCGDVRVLGKEKLAKDIVDSINELSSDKKSLKRKSALLKNVVDGYGSNRIIEEIYKKK